MSDVIYYCENKDNDCPKREECKRFLDADRHMMKATLYKNACRDWNDYVLFIKNVTDVTKEE